ncbi:MULTISPECIES: hypothetical protein [Spirulina sp. CCY15215]|nr:hypothetical protein [Spirulina major]
MTAVVAEHITITSEICGGKPFDPPRSKETGIRKQSNNGLLQA